MFSDKAHAKNTSILDLEQVNTYQICFSFTDNASYKAEKKVLNFKRKSKNESKDAIPNIKLVSLGKKFFKCSI